jgi:hypothetical protein
MGYMERNQSVELSGNLSVLSKRKLKTWCNANGCPSDPTYRAGIGAGLERLLRARSAASKDGNE